MTPKPRNRVRDVYERYLAGKATFEEVNAATDRAAEDYQQRSDDTQDSSRRPPPHASGADR